MGDFNSSVTRVWPVFDRLFTRDPKGATWLASLMGSGSRAALVDKHLLSDPGVLMPELVRFERPLPAQLAKALGADQAARIGSIRNAYEVELPPPSAFLQWMIEHPERLTWPKSDGQFGAHTLDMRKRLFDGDTAVREKALSELVAQKAQGSRRKWWAFEGFTSADCCLETETLLLLIEGKRTEPMSASTHWFPCRNQVIRNLEVAQQAAAGRNFAVLLCSENLFDDLPKESWTKSLPHLSDTQIEELRSHYLGCVSWSSIVERLCPDLKLPNLVDDAVTLCLDLRT